MIQVICSQTTSPEISVIHTFQIVETRFGVEPGTDQELAVTLWQLTNGPETVPGSPETNK